MTDKIERFRGDTYADVLEVKADGVALDVTGHSFKMTVSRSEDPLDTSAQLYSLDGTITDAANGIVEFAPSAVQADQEPKRYFYDIQMIDAGGLIRTIKKNEYRYKQDVTK